MGMQRAELVCRTPGVRLAAVCDTDPARCREAAARFGCPAFRDYDALLAQSDCDCVYVMTPTHLHLPMVERAAAAGRHVILTKPMETTLARAERIREVCRAAGVVLVVDHELRYTPLMRQVHRAVHDGTLGEILNLEARLNWFRGPDYYRSTRGTRRGDGGGVFAIQAVHLLDQLIWLGGMPSRVQAHLATLEKPIDVEDQGVVLLRYPESRRRGVALASTLFGDDVEFGVVVTGTRGAVDTTRALHGMHRRAAEWFARPGVDWRVPPAPDGPESAVADLVSALRGHRPPQCGAEVGLNCLRLLDAVYRSAAESPPVWADVK